MVRRRRARDGLRTGPRSSRGAHSVPRFALSENMATRTSPELVWGSFWVAFQAGRGGGDYHDGNVEQNA
eukprot:9036574-Alexandrium_andersonii.AAC.1